jgi:hypothetical protein
MTDSDTSSRLRHEIDQGLAGDKVKGSDPAAAPLGTDDEAAGQPPTTEQVALARQHEARSTIDGRTSDPGAPTATSQQAWLRPAMIVAGVVVLIAVLALLF